MDSEIKWIPVDYHRITEEEKQENDYPEDWVYCIDSPMPEEGQEILISTNEGYVEKDTCLNDGEGYYSENGYDWCGDIKAWMPLPEPYKNEGEQNKKSDSKISVGDTVFETDGVNVYESTVRRILYDTKNMTFDTDAIGSSIFLTRKEAEERMEHYGKP